MKHLCIYATSNPYTWMETKFQYQFNVYINIYFKVGQFKIDISQFSSVTYIKKQTPKIIIICNNAKQTYQP